MNTRPLSHLALRAAALLGLFCPALASAHVALDPTAGPSGVFRLDDGGKLYVAPMVDESGPTLQFALTTGLEGRARKQPDGSFADDAACSHRIAFSAAADQVDWTDCHARHHGRRELALREQPLTFQASDGRTLGASIWTAGKGERLGVVLAHGADDETRQMGTLVPLFVETGLAVLTFDQRGSGQSGGDWRADGISQVANDVAQAATLLQSRTGVRSVGFYGFSNGGWVAPAAAVRYGKPAFVVIKSGDSETVAENVLFETSAAVKASSGAQAAARAREVMGLLLHALQTDGAEDWARAREALAAVKGQPWLAHTQLPPAEALPLPAAVKAGFRRQLIFDPKEDLLRLRCPVLVMLGDADTDVDGPASARLYRAYFGQSHNRRAKVVLFHDAGHQLALGPGPAANNSLRTGTYAPGYPSRMLAWLKALKRDESRQATSGP